MVRSARFLLAGATGLLLWLGGACLASDESGETPGKTAGWRGNWTGLYPDATPPAEWGRLAKGAVATARCQAARPASADAPPVGQPLDDGLIRDWLIVGPLDVADSIKDLEAAQLADEANLAPAEGEKAGALAWRRLQLVKKPDYERWGTTELDWIDLAEPPGAKVNQVAYAFSYFYCEQAGGADVVVEHDHGLKVWLNGKAIYSDPKRQMVLSSYVGISRQKQDLVHHRSPAFRIDLRKGPNRLLVKLSSPREGAMPAMRFAARLMDAQPGYEDRNILWATQMPERTNACPIIVGDRVFTAAEPDELLCLDKKTGRVLWRRQNGLHDAAAPEERAAKPVFREKIDPLAEQLAVTADQDYEESLGLRRQIRDLLIAADEDRYRLKWDGHLAAHFGIVGFTTTPVSDGRSVFVFCGNGVAACYDLEGKRQWIRRLPAERVRYSCTPALAGGRLMVIFEGLHALDARTGQTAWHVPKAASIASLIPARIAGTDVVFTRGGDAYRVSDGRQMWANPHARSGDTGWAAPLILGQTMYLPWSGVGGLIVADFTGAAGDAWQPKVRTVELATDHRRPSGEWLDRWTASSPLVYEGIYYNVDQYGVAYAVDLEMGKTLYKQDLGFDELHHYNAIGVGASLALGGRRIYAVDNQGTCVVYETGRAFKQVAVNSIGTRIRRDWPIGPQELLANGPPVFDGDRIFIRGERFLYCIGPRGG